MPVASRTEISLLFRRLEWAAQKRAQDVAAKGLAQTNSEPNPSTGDAPAAGGKAGWRLLQLGRGLWDALWDLGELQVGALNHAGFTAALRGADHIAVALTVQLVILRPCAPVRAAWGPTGRGTGAVPALPSLLLPHPQLVSGSSPAPLIPGLCTNYSSPCPKHLICKGICPGYTGCCVTHHPLLSCNRSWTTWTPLCPSG